MGWTWRKRVEAKLISCLLLLTKGISTPCRRGGAYDRTLLSHGWRVHLASNSIMVCPTLPIETEPNYIFILSSLVLFWPSLLMSEARSCGMTCAPVCISRTLTCVSISELRHRCHDSQTCQGDYRQWCSKWEHYARWEFCNVRTPYDTGALFAYGLQQPRRTRWDSYSSYKLARLRV